MAAGASRRPSGKISEVYDNAAERQGAYDFVESELTSATAMSEALSASTALRCAEHPWVYVPVDGTSFAAPTDARVLAFQRGLTDAGYSCFVRTRRGDAVDAACGQLALSRDIVELKRPAARG